MKMNNMMNTLTTNVTRTFNRGVFQLKKCSPELLVIGGCVGVVATVVMAVKATPKALDILAESEKQLDAVHKCEEEEPEETYTKDDAKKDKVIVYANTGLKLAKTYGPTVLVGVASITSILAGHNILRKRNAALSAAYATLNQSFAEYRDRLKERYGEQTDYELRHGIKVDSLAGPDAEPKESEQTPVPRKVNEYTKLFDETNENYQKNAGQNMAFLKGQQRFANDLLVSKGYVTLNEVYEMLGFPKYEQTAVGHTMGWVYDPKRCGEDQIQFGIYDISRQDVRDFINGYERAIWLDFNVNGDVRSVFA